MNETFAKPLDYFRKLSPLKKVLTVFLFLLIFIIIIEQPGNHASGRRENAQFFIPKLIISEVKKIQISRLADNKQVVLEKLDGQWRVANGHAFPADNQKLQGFLKAMYNLKQGALVSKNPERKAVFSVDEQKGVHVELWGSKERMVADFYAGENIPDGQYLRRAQENEVFQTTPTLISFLMQSLDDWKDKVMLNVTEADARRVSLKKPTGEIVLEKGENSWHVIQPEDYEAETLAVRTLFEQLNGVQADAFADNVSGSQMDFEKPDYKISVRLGDDSLKLLLFSGPDKEGKYYAKNADTDFIYLVSDSLIGNIFDLEFKVSDLP